MGSVFAMSACYGCGMIFSYNPHRVPSIRINGVREPVCLNCMTIANNKRIEMGVEPHFIYRDAYEPIDENEL